MASALTKMIKAAKSQKIVTPRLEKFLAKNGPDFSVPETIKEWAWTEIANKTKITRHSAWRSSSLHMCERRQMFAYKDTPIDQGISNDLAMIFTDGRFRHLRWQVMLLSAGILSAVEVPWGLPEYNLAGTMDGVGSFIDEEFGWELKGINSFGYKNVVTWDRPKEEHLFQVHAYMLGNPHIKRFSLIYEDKNTNQYHEIVVDRDEEIIDRVKKTLERLNTHLNMSTMPPIYEECKQQSGMWIRCPYADVCLKTPEGEAF